MEIDLSERLEQIKELDYFIETEKNRFDNVLNELDWKQEKLKEEVTSLNCPINPSHLLVLKSAEEHIKKCKIKTQGYNLDEQFLSEPTTSTAIKLDKVLKYQILTQAHAMNYGFRAAWDGTDVEPMTSDRLLSTFSPDERLALYNFCIQNTVKPDVPEEINLFFEDKYENEKSLTLEEKLELQRDAKRRRIKYKSVHTNKKSHTEIMKEVIENQMETYINFLSRQDKSYKNINTNTQDPSESGKDLEKSASLESESKYENEERPNSAVSKHSTHSSGSRYHKRNHEYEKYKDDKYLEKNDTQYSTRFSKEEIGYKKHYYNDHSREHSRDRHYREYPRDSCSDHQSRGHSRDLKSYHSRESSRDYSKKYHSKDRDYIKGHRSREHSRDRLKGHHSREHSRDRVIRHRSREHSRERWYKSSDRKHSYYNAERH